MSQIDVKLGIQSILGRVNEAFASRAAELSLAILNFHQDFRSICASKLKAILVVLEIDTRTCVTFPAKEFLTDVKCMELAKTEMLTALEIQSQAKPVGYAGLAIKTKKPILVAVSKTKPAELIVEAYETGQRDFGENYVRELKEKGTNPLILEKCKDIRWHFIGHLQQRNVNKVLNTQGIYMIETIHSERIATAVNNSWERINKTNKEPLKILIQVNTSNEEEKNGIDPTNVVPLCRHILDTCKNLKLEGLMTIGKFGHDYSTGPNPDFISLMKCHKDLCEALSFNEADVEVSMGMSDDFEEAIKMGSTIVRVGSSIFGYREKKEN